MKITVIAIKKDKNTGKDIERHQEIYKNEVACIYESGGKTFISKKNGYMTRIKHKLSEIAPYFLGDLSVRERSE